MEVKLCKETAQEQIRQFGKAWGLYDAKAVITGGKESSIPEEVRDLMLANVMTGDIEFIDDGRKIIQHLSSDILGLDKLVYARKIRRHNLRDLMDLAQDEQAVALASACTDVPLPKFAELTSRDNAVMMAITAYISFS